MIAIFKADQEVQAHPPKDGVSSKVLPCCWQPTRGNKDLSQPHTPLSARSSSPASTTCLLAEAH